MVYHISIKTIFSRFFGNSKFQAKCYTCHHINVFFPVSGCMSRQTCCRIFPWTAEITCSAPCDVGFVAEPHQRCHNVGNPRGEVLRPPLKYNYKFFEWTYRSKMSVLLTFHKFTWVHIAIKSVKIKPCILYFILFQHSFFCGQIWKCTLTRPFS